MKKYILRGKEPVEEPDLTKWAHWYGRHDRSVQRDDVGDCLISTAFLGIDHNFTGKGPPVLFETMVFRKGEEIYCERSCTWDEALEKHNETLQRMQRELS